MSSRYEKWLEKIANGEQITEEPVCRREIFLKAIANKEGASNLPEPICREEKMLKAIAAGETIKDTPTCRREEIWKAIANDEPLPASGQFSIEEKILKQIHTEDAISSTKMYVVTFDKGVTVQNGDDVVASGAKVEEGTVLTIGYTLSEGHHLGHFRVNGTDVENNTNITVTRNMTISFSELQNTYMVTFDEGVTVYDETEARYIGSGSGLLYGTRITVSYTLSDGYKLVSFQINGEDIENDTTVTVKNTTAITFVQEPIVAARLNYVSYGMFYIREARSVEQTADALILR